MKALIACIAIPVLAIVTIPAFAGEKPWTEVRSPHFRVLTNGSQSDARQLAREFEQMRYVFANGFPGFRLEGGAPMVVFAALDEATAKSLEPRTWKTKGVKPAGIFHHAWEKEYVMLQVEAWRQGSIEIVYHEYTHSILHLNFHWLPVWLDEGLADFYGYTRFRQHEVLIGAPPARYGRMPGTTLIPIETLIGVTHNSPYYHDEDKVHQFYTESWGLVHFLTFGPGMDREKRLNQFFTLLQQGMEQKKAFLQVFGNFTDMDNALRMYMSNLAFQSGVAPPSPKIDEKTFNSRTLSIAETEAELGGFHLWTHDLTGARILVEQALNHDPKLGLAHEEMGFLNFSDGKDAEAQAEFAQACSLDPTLSLSLFAKTMMSPIATSYALEDEDAFHAAMAKMLELNPQFGPAYVQLARLWLRKNDPKTAFGVARKAEELEPMRAGYHLLSGEILLRLGKGTEAATFARFVAQRWPGADHDEAVELWNAVPPDQRPAGDAPSVNLPKEIKSVQGKIITAVCSTEDHALSLTLNHEGQTSTFRGKEPSEWGFSDTIWYGADHFSLCHHIDDMRAVVNYRPASGPSYTGDVTEVEIRDDLPEPLKKAMISTPLVSRARRRKASSSAEVQ